MSGHNLCIIHCAGPLQQIAYCHEIFDSAAQWPRSAEIHRPHYIGSNTIHAFPVRVITVWNRLPTHVVLASSLLSLKISLKNVDLTYTLFGKI